MFHKHLNYNLTNDVHFTTKMHLKTDRHKSRQAVGRLAGKHTGRQMGCNKQIGDGQGRRQAASSRHAGSL